MAKYNLKVEGDIVSTHDTLDEAFKARNDTVRDICRDLYDQGEIDKYAVQDWCFNLEENKDMEFYIDEFCGYAIDIEEVNETPEET